MNRLFAWVLALFLAVSPAIADGVAVPGVPSVGQVGSAVSYPPANAATFSALINFRATSGYVTDGGGQTYSIGDAFPTLRAGLTFGWTSISGSIQTRDRTTSNGPRFAGINFSGSTGVNEFTITLPAPGVYKVNYAINDPGGESQSTQVTIKDNTTTLNTSGTLVTTTNIYDINGTSYASPSAYTAGTTPISLTFATTTFNLILTGSGGAGVITNLSVTQ